jgi:hypothetical protein
VAASDADVNEDWVKTQSWDFQNPDGTTVNRFSDMWPWFTRPLTGTALEEVQRFTASPAWQGAPDELRTETSSALAEADVAERTARSRAGQQW